MIENHESINIQYTISVLSGAYAQKYSIIFYSKQRTCLEKLFERYAPELKTLVQLKDGEKAEFDPYMIFQSVMKMLKYFSKHKKLTFCSHIEKTSGDSVETGDFFEDKDENGDFNVRAFEESGITTDANGEASFEVRKGENGSYRAVVVPVMDLVKDDLMGMLNLCEEAMAKNGNLVASVVPADTPAPAPLFRL